MTAQGYFPGNKDKSIPKGPPLWRSSRFLLAILSAWGMANLFFQRINLSMAIVCMVNNTALDIMASEQTSGHEHSTLTSNATMFKSDILRNHSPRSNDSSSGFTTDHLSEWNLTLSGGCSSIVGASSQAEDGELVWSRTTQGLVLGSFYAGHTLLQIPSQRIIQHVGAKRLAGLSTGVMSVLTMCMPHAAWASPWLMLSIRVIHGILSALIMAALYSMWGAWAPPPERTRLISICMSGGMIGNAIVYVASGYLCQYGFAGGWPSTFYVFGIVGFVWCLIWQCLVFETPESHPRIDHRERTYIVASIGVRTHGNKGSIPWMKIFRSAPAWAVVMGTVGYAWPNFLLLAVMPQYMKEVLNFDIESNGLYSTMPYILLFLFTNVWGVVCDQLQNRRSVSIAFVRKMSTVIGTVIPGVFYIALSFLDCTQPLTAVVLITLAIGLSGSNFQGYLVNPYDIAPRYATAIIGLSHSVAAALGFVSPYVVAALTVDKTREQWQQVFFLTSAIIILCCIFFLIFGRGTQMEWTKDLNFTINVPTKTDPGDAHQDKKLTHLQGHVNTAFSDSEKGTNGSPFIIYSGNTAPTRVVLSDFVIKSTDPAVLEITESTRL